jgi:F-type H+-transporting ATPase subunit c
MKVFTVLTCLALVLAVGGSAFAQDPAKEQLEHTRAVEKQKATSPANSTSYLGLALGFSLAIAAAMGAFSQSRAISAALDGVARQPEAGGRIQTMMLIGVVFIETLVIFTWVLVFLWGAKV